MIQSLAKLRGLFTDALLRKKSCQSPLVKLEGHSVPPTFASAMLKLSPTQERTPFVFFPKVPEDNIEFYGHKCIAKSSSAFITTTFGCPEDSLRSRMFRQPSLPYFIAFIIHETQVPYSVVSSAHILLQRYQSNLPLDFDSSKLTSSHRLFMTSYIYAVQEYWPRNEKVFDNEYWSQISNFPASDIGIMLDHFYDKLEGQVGFSSTFRTITDIKEDPSLVIMAYHDADPNGLGNKALESKVSSIFSRKKKGL